MRPLSRRDALKLGAAALASGLLRPAPVLADAESVPLFELPLDDAAARAAAAGGWRTTRVVRAPRRFDMVGLRWTRGAVEAQVRARQRGGAWSEWAPLHAAAGHAPDAARGRPATEPAFTGAADELQLRLRGRAAGLRARFVHAQPSARAAGGPARLSQAPGAPPIVPRHDWGGDLLPPKARPEYGAVQLAFVHHTVTANDYGPEDSAGIVLGICRYHRDSNGWNDIGYNFLVDKYGQVFEGRAGGVEQAVVGAQAQGYNTASTGIACIGTFSAVVQSEPGMEALARLIGWKLSLHGAPVEGPVAVESRGGSANRYPAGRIVTFQRISGHRDGDATSCPGDVLYGQLADLRTRAARYARPVSALTAKVATARVRWPRQHVLSGQLRFADGAPAAGARVELERQGADGAWQRLADAVCGPDGGWSLRLTLPGSGRVRARFAGDAAHPPLESTPIVLTVVPRLALRLARTRVRAGDVVAVAGECNPTPLPALVAVVIERRVGRRWLPVQTKRINVRGGRFATRARLRRAGLYRVSIGTTGAVARRRVRVL